MSDLCRHSYPTRKSRIRLWICSYRRVIGVFSRVWGTGCATRPFPISISKRYNLSLTSYGSKVVQRTCAPCQSYTSVFHSIFGQNARLAHPVWVWCPWEIMNPSLPVADPGFSPGERANSQIGIILHIFGRKLHETERILIQGGARPWRPP